MRVVVVWREESDYARSVREWLRELSRRVGRLPEIYNPDEPDGESICRAYGVMEYPTILALDTDGRVLQSWSGDMLPRVDDVSYYLLNS